MKKEAADALKKISGLPEAVQQVTLAAFLSRIFKKRGMDFILVGGATVQFYTQAQYQTGDIDVILRGDTKEVVEEIMHSLGFKRVTNYRQFENPLFRFSVEFPPAPIEIGNRTITKVVSVETPEGPLDMLRIEDILMDRIIAGVEWKDPQSIEQAKLLWQLNRKRIDLDYLLDFAKKEGYLKILREVMKLG
jgi:hypothetical protein